MDLNPDNYTLNEISQFFNLKPNHTFTEINDAFRRKHNEATLSRNLSRDQKNQMCSFYEELKNKLVIHLSKSNVPHNEFNNGPSNIRNNEKIDDHVNTVTNNAILYPAGTSKEISAGIMNPIERNILKNVIHFDTRFKQNYVIESTSDKCKNTKFSFNMPTGFKNVISVKLSSFELPKHIYNISKAMGNNTFTYNVGVRDVDAEIPEGRYTATTLVTKLNNLTGLTVTRDEDSGKIKIAGNNLQLKFPAVRDRVNLGYLLGFTKKTYAAAANHTAESIPKLELENEYYYFSFNDYQQSVNHNHFAVMNKNFVTKNIFAKLKDDESEENNTDYFVKKSYFGPVTLNRVTFELLDKYGNALDLKGADYSFSIEIEILYKY
tara:strand:+ start:247 stop:1380 length:1134 start_codon:yes stop_codon:yes gene_type:complete